MYASCCIPVVIKLLLFLVVQKTYRNSSAAFRLKNNTRDCSKADQRNAAQQFVTFTDWILQLRKAITLQLCLLLHTHDLFVSAVHELAFTVTAHYVNDVKMRQKVQDFEFIYCNETVKVKEMLSNP